MKIGPVLREQVVVPKRTPIGRAMKKRIWERERGICWWCGEPVEMFGPRTRYDHKNPRELSADDSEENIFPIHRNPCDRRKYSGEDRPRIDKTRRMLKKQSLAAEKKKPRHPLKSRTTWPKGRKLQSRPGGWPKGRKLPSRRRKR